MEYKGTRFFDKYVPLIISFIIVLLFLSAIENFDGALWHWIDAIITIFTLIMVYISYKEQQKQLELIEIYIDIEGTLCKIPVYIIRKNFTRAEIKGILRGLVKNDSYSIEYIDNPRSTFLKDVIAIQQGQKDKLIITIEPQDQCEFKDNICENQRYESK